MDQTKSPRESKTSEYPESLDRLVLGIARALVDTPSAVSLDLITRDHVLVLRLFVAPNEIGQIIGSQGRIARSLRTIVGAASMKMRCHARLEIMNKLVPPE